MMDTLAEKLVDELNRQFQDETHGFIMWCEKNFPTMFMLNGVPQEKIVVAERVFCGAAPGLLPNMICEALQRHGFEAQFENNEYKLRILHQLNSKK